MSERAAYSRVYWTIRNDDRLSTIYPDDRLLAAWLRLLIAADMAWPASADIPASVNKRSLQSLCDAGVISVNGTLFTFHGLDSERTRRGDPSRRANEVRWGTERSQDGVKTDSRRSLDAVADKTRQDKTRHPRASARDVSDGASTDPRPLRDILGSMGFTPPKKDGES